MSISIDNGVASFYIDDVLQGTATAGTLYTGTDLGFASLYYAAGLTNGADMLISELVVFDHPVSTTDHTLVANFLKSKWGI